MQRLGDSLRSIALGQALLLLVVLSRVQRDAGGVVQLFLGHLPLRSLSLLSLAANLLPSALPLSTARLLALSVLQLIPPDD